MIILVYLHLSLDSSCLLFAENFQVELNNIYAIKVRRILWAFLQLVAFESGKFGCLKTKNVGNCFLPNKIWLMPNIPIWANSRASS